MRYKIENLADIDDAKSFMHQYKAACSYKLLKYSMYLIVLTLCTLVIWSRFAKRDIVVHAFGVIDAKNEVCEIYIENTNIGNIKAGKEARLEVVSLSRNEYGVLTSKIAKVSDDVVTDQGSGRKFYTAMCPLEKNTMTSKTGEQVKLKSGMDAKVNIICRKTTYFEYLLDKLR